MINPYDKINKYNEIVKDASLSDIIRFVDKEFGPSVVFASSLGEEDQVITDIIAKTAPAIRIFTLDTGRLFPETYALLAKTQKKYPMKIKVYYPQTEAVEKMVEEKGIDLFYESIENRQLCCEIRKVQPLQRALKGFEAWICGLRKDQAVTRTNINIFEWDKANQKIKINPLANWSYEKLRDYIRTNHVDINPLHQRGFLSIGCACCTRAVQPGEDIRAGRWWWESPEKKECGLHRHSHHRKA